MIHPLLPIASILIKSITFLVVVVNEQIFHFRH